MIDNQSIFCPKQQVERWKHHIKECCWLLQHSWQHKEVPGVPQTLCRYYCSSWIAHPYVPQPACSASQHVMSIEEGPGDRSVHKEKWGGCHGMSTQLHTIICSFVQEERGGTIQSDLQLATHVHVSAQTVRNRFREGGMRLQPSQVGPVLTLQSRWDWRISCRLLHPPAWPVWWWVSDSQRHVHVHGGIHVLVRGTLTLFGTPGT